MSEAFSTKSKKSSKKADSTSPKASHSSDHTHSKGKRHRHVDEYSEVMRHEHPTSNPLAAYVPKPNNAHFESQAESETIVLLLRRHPVTNIPWIVMALILAVVPIAIQFVPFFIFIPPNFYPIIILGWYMIVFAYTLEKFLTWFFNVMIITDERIVDIDFENLIYKRISSAKIDNIEDVTGVTGGFLRSMLNFGTVIVQTAGVEQEFEFLDVPHPDRVIKLLNELILEEEREALEGRAN